MIVPFKTPLDYWLGPLEQKPENINKWPEIQKTYGWEQYDNELHIYPYTRAKACMLSMGCKNKCFFCNTAKHFQGKIYYGDPEIILSHYQNQNIAFVDEDFLDNDMRVILPLLRKYGIKWNCLTTNQSLAKCVDEFGEDYLYECGCRLVKNGLENVVLMFKIKHEQHFQKIAMYYMNVSLMPGETKEIILENAKWMRSRSLKKPIHHNNGLCMPRANSIIHILVVRME